MEKKTTVPKALQAEYELREREKRSESIRGAQTSYPKNLPKKAPKPHNTTECHSILIFIQKMANIAADILQDWTMREKSLATEGTTPRAKVMTGKATARAPS